MEAERRIGYSNREDDNHNNSNNKDPSHDMDHYVEQIIEQHEQLKKEKKELDKKSQYLEKRIRNHRKSHKSSKNSNNYDTDKATIIELFKECKKENKIKTRPPVFKEESNPRLFVVRFDNWIKLEGIDDQKAALAFKNAIEDEIVLLQLSRLPEDIKNSYEQLKYQFIVTNDTNSNEFYKNFTKESLKQKIESL